LDVLLDLGRRLFRSRGRVFARFRGVARCFGSCGASIRSCLTRGRRGIRTRLLGSVGRSLARLFGGLARVLGSLSCFLGCLGGILGCRRLLFGATERER